MLYGSYNGWTDMPEDEREALGMYEATTDEALKRVAAAMGLSVTRAGRLVTFHAAGAS